MSDQRRRELAEMLANGSDMGGYSPQQAFGARDPREFAIRESASPLDFAGPGWVRPAGNAAWGILNYKLMAPDRYGRMAGESRVPAVAMGVGQSMLGLGGNIAEWLHGGGKVQPSQDAEGQPDGFYGNQRRR